MIATLKIQACNYKPDLVFRSPGRTATETRNKKVHFYITNVTKIPNNNRSKLKSKRIAKSLFSSITLIRMNQITLDSIDTKQNTILLM